MTNVKSESYGVRDSVTDWMFKPNRFRKYVRFLGYTNLRLFVPLRMTLQKLQTKNLIISDEVLYGKFKNELSFFSVCAFRSCFCC